MQVAQLQNPILTSVHRREMRLMDIIFEISVVADDEIWAIERISNAFAEIYRIENLLANGNRQSQASLINNNAGIQPVKVDQEVFNLIDRSLKISELTHGVFDITHTPIHNQPLDIDVNPLAMPGGLNSPQVDYRNIILNAKNTTVFLKEKGMRIDLSVISKGYIADRVKYLLQMQGVSSGVISANNDLITWGRQPNGNPWTIAAAAPHRDIIPMSNLNISNMAITTSVNTQNYTVVKGKKQTHATHTKTGLPLSGIKSVSILSPSAELADAMAIPVMTMGVKVSLNFINRLNQIACVITNHRKKIYTSKNLSY